MRLLAALTIFGFMGPSLNASASQPQLEWEYEVEVQSLVPGATLSGGFENSTPVLSPDGMCAMIFSIQIQFGGPSPSTLYVIAVLNEEGLPVWRGVTGSSAPTVIHLTKESLVYRAVVGPGGIRFFTVPLETVTLMEPATGRLEDTDGMAAYALQTSSSATSFLSYTGNPIPDGMPLVIKKWTIPREEVDLVASFFSLEDGNLILSWPTTAGEIYQVQRSTDLESWENIGVTLTGNGTTMSYSQPSTAEKVFLRVVLP